MKDEEQEKLYTLDQAFTYAESDDGRDLERTLLCIGFLCERVDEHFNQNNVGLLAGIVQLARDCAEEVRSIQLQRLEKKAEAAATPPAASPSVQ